MVSDLMQTPEKSRVEKIIEQINATNAKKVALLLVIGFACYHELLHVKYGEYKNMKCLIPLCCTVNLKAQIHVAGYFLMGVTKEIKNGSRMVVCYIDTQICKLTLK